MLKTIPLLFVAILSFNSCNLLTDWVEEEPHYLEFVVAPNAYSSRTDVADNYLDIDNIGVCAYLDRGGDPFFDNVLVERCGHEWYYSSPLDWNEIEDFDTIYYAYAPHSSIGDFVNVTSHRSSLELRYKVPFEADNHPYVMVSFPVRQERNNNDPIRFVMQHPLAVISFSSNEEGVESITLSGVTTQSTLTLNLDGTYSWAEVETVGSVVAQVGDNLMLIPQSVDSDVVVEVDYGDRIISYDLEDDTWDANERVDYIIAADSIYHAN